MINTNQPKPFLSFCPGIFLDKRIPIKIPATENAVNMPSSFQNYNKQTENTENFHDSLLC